MQCGWIRGFNSALVTAAVSKWEDRDHQMEDQEEEEDDEEEEEETVDENQPEVKKIERKLFL